MMTTPHSTFLSFGPRPVMSHSFRKPAVLDYPLATSTKSSVTSAAPASKIASTRATSSRSSTTTKSAVLKAPFGTNQNAPPTYKVSGFKSSDTSPQFDTPYQMDFVDMKKLYYQLHDEYTALRTECAELQATVESMQIEHETRSNQMRAEAAARGLIWHHDRWTHPDLIPTLGKVSFANQQHLAEEEERLHFQVENEHLQRETRRLRGQASQPASVAASTTSTPRPAQPNTELPPTAPQTELQLIRARIESEQAEFQRASAENEAVIAELRRMIAELQAQIQAVSQEMKTSSSTLKKLSDQQIRLQAKVAARSAMLAVTAELDTSYSFLQHTPNVPSESQSARRRADAQLAAEEAREAEAAAQIDALQRKLEYLTQRAEAIEVLPAESDSNTELAIGAVETQEFRVQFNDASQIAEPAMNNPSPSEDEESFQVHMARDTSANDDL